MGRSTKTAAVAIDEAVDFDRVYEILMSLNADDFAQKLKAKMRRHGMSQGELARRYGSHKGNISNWLNGPKKADIVTRLELAWAVAKFVAEAEEERKEEQRAAALKKEVAELEAQLLK